MASLLLFIVAIAALIVVHDFGHFIAAKISGIPVQEFGIGFPPRMLRLFRWRETDFTLNWIPLGGFVRPAGETDPDVPDGLSAASPLKRIFVLAAGPGMNLLASLLLYAFLFSQLGRPDFNQVEILDVQAGSPAAQAGLLVGDIVLAVDGEPVDSTVELHDLIYANLGEPITLSYLRDGSEGTATLVPRDPPPDSGAIGIAMGNPRLPIGPGQAIWYGGEAIYQQVNALVSLPGQLISGSVSPNEGRLVGYKGMYDIYTEVRQADVELGESIPSGLNTLAFFASISISLALINLLPVPALDGGRILFALPELIFGKRIPAAFENAFNLVGLALLVFLAIYINLQDFINPIVIP
jgi:regulator of sigma E protease